MSCAFSRETLALHVEGDLPDEATEKTSAHLATCDDCRRFLEQLLVRVELGRIVEVFVLERLGRTGNGVTQSDHLDIRNFHHLLRVPVGHSTAADESKVEHERVPSVNE